MKNQLLIRQLDPGEAFFYMSDQISCMNFVFMAERTGHLDIGKIQTGLAVIQQENLLLRAAIAWTAEHGLNFVAAAACPIELACHDVDAGQWQHWIEQELGRPFAEGSAPLVRCLYLEASTPDRSILALTFHHSIADGRSGNELIRRLLDCIASQALAEQVPGSTTLPPMRDLFPAHFRWKEHPDEAAHAWKVMLSDYKRNGPPPALPWLSSKSATRTPRLIRLSFPAEVTSNLLAQARQHGTSIHGALCAAQLLAQLPLQENDNPSAFFLSSPVDMRPHLVPIQPAVPVGLYVSVISASFLLDTEKTFWQLAQDIIAQTRLQLGRGEGHLFFDMFGLDTLPILPDRMERFSKKLMSTWHHTVVSNIGRIANVGSDPEIEAISFALCPMPYQALFCAATTYKNQLIVNVGYDEGKMGAQTAAMLSDGIRERLLRAADVG